MGRREWGGGEGLKNFLYFQMLAQHLTCVYYKHRTQEGYTQATGLQAEKDLGQNVSETIYELKRNLGSGDLVQSFDL